MPDLEIPLLRPSVLTERPREIPLYYWERVLDSRITPEELELFHAGSNDVRLIRHSRGIAAERQWMCMVLGRPGMQDAEAQAFIKKARELRIPPDVIAIACASLEKCGHFFWFVKYCPGVEERASILWALCALGKEAMLKEYLKHHIKPEQLLTLIRDENYRALQAALDYNAGSALFTTLFQQLPQEWHVEALSQTGIKAITVALRDRLSDEAAPLVFWVQPAAMEHYEKELQELFAQLARLSLVDHARYLLNIAGEKAEALALGHVTSPFEMALKADNPEMLSLLLSFPKVFDYAQNEKYSSCYMLLTNFALCMAEELSRSPTTLTEREKELAALLLEFLKENHPFNHYDRKVLLQKIPGVSEACDLRIQDHLLRAPTLSIFNLPQAVWRSVGSAEEDHTQSSASGLSAGTSSSDSAS